MVASGAAPESGQHLWREQGSPTSRPAARCSRHRAELNLHSVTLLGSVWTLHHPIERHQPKLRSADKSTGTGAASETSTPPICARLTR